MRSEELAVRYRRRFLKHLLASPLALQFGAAQSGYMPAAKGSVTASSAVNVYDLAGAAVQKVPPHHFAYLATGGDDEKTLRRNTEAFDDYEILPKRFVDISKMDLSCELFGQRYSTPVILSPVGSQKAFHPDAELASAKGAAAMGNQFTISTVSSVSVGEVAKVYNRPVWFQLYPTDTWAVTEAILRKAEDAGCTVLVMTVDNGASSNREQLIRARLASKVPCNSCHKPGVQGYLSTRRTFDGIDFSAVKTHLGVYTWPLIDRIRKATKMKLVAKGILTAEDAADCVRNGLDAVWVSNHGGRQLNSLRASLDALPEVVEAVAGRCPVLFDSGVRRGTDIFKALALGASAVCIGRPYIWGLGAYGQEGVQRALELLSNELLIDMRLAGTPTVADITKKFVRRRPFR